MKNPKITLTHEGLNNEQEIWRDIVGYEGFYKVSNLGKVISVRTGKQMKPYLVFSYFRVHLRKDGISKGKFLHRSIAEAFIPNPYNKPCINHIDGVKSNNSLENLEWVTISENTKHAYRLGLTKVKKGISKKLICTETGIEYASIKDAAKALGINYGYLKGMVNPKHHNRNLTTLVYKTKATT